MSRTIAPRKKNKADEECFDVELNILSLEGDGEITSKSNKGRAMRSLNL